jgi:DUF1365 family protein
VRHRLRGPNAVIDRSGGPAIYRCSVSHPPLRRYRTYLWSVDLDDLPRTPRLLAHFRPSDHLGEGPSIRANLESFLATQGIDLDGGRIRLVTAARVLGYVFNPLSVYWCHNRAGDLICVVAEVPDGHYLMRGETGSFDMPFGCTLSLPEPGDELKLEVALHRAGQTPLVTRVHGRRRPATKAVIARFAWRFPVVPLAGTARGRLQGVRLWVRGLPVLVRPARAWLF